MTTELTVGSTVWLHVRDAEPREAVITGVDPDQDTVIVSFAGAGGQPDHRQGVPFCPPGETVGEDVECYCTLTSDTAESAPEPEADPTGAPGSESPDPGSEPRPGEQPEGEPAKATQAETETELLE